MDWTTGLAIMGLCTTAVVAFTVVVVRTVAG